MKQKNTNLIHVKAFVCGIRDQVTLDGVQIYLTDLLESQVRGGKNAAAAKIKKYGLSDDPKDIANRERVRRWREKQKQA